MRLLKARETQWLLAVVLLGLLLRLYRLGWQYPTSDEALMVLRARMPGAVYLRLYGLDLHAIVQHWWASWGADYLTFRWLSVLLGTVGIVVAYQMAAASGDRRVGLLCAAWVATSPFLVFYSREMRFYPLLFLCAAGALLLLIRVERKGSGVPLVAYGLTVSAAFSANALIGAELATAGALSCLLWWRRLPRRLSWLAVLTHLAIAAAFSGIARSVPADSRFGQQLGRSVLRSGHCWRPAEACTSLLGAWADLQLNQSNTTGLLNDHPLVLLAGTGMFALVLLGAWKVRSCPAEATPLLAFLLVPLAATSLYICTTPCPITPRYYIAMVPAYALLMVAGWRAAFTKSPLLTGVFALAVAGAMLFSLRNTYFSLEHRGTPWEKPVEFVDQRTREGDAIIVPPFSGPFVDVYQRRRTPVLAAFPAADGRAIVLAGRHDSWHSTLFDFELTPNALRHRYRRLWAFYRDEGVGRGDDSPSSCIRLTLKAFAESRVGEWHFPGLRVYLYDLRSSSAVKNAAESDSREVLAPASRCRTSRREVAARYSESFADLDWIETPVERPYTRSACHNYVVKVPCRDELQDFLREREIATGVHYLPLHHHPILAHCSADVPATDLVWKRILTLPLFPGLTDQEVEHVIASVRGFPREARRDAGA